MPNIALDSGVNITYRDEGQGPPVVLVHGYTGGRWYWRHMIEHFAKSHRLIALDLKGHGDSDKPEPKTSPYGIPEYAQEVDEFLIKVGVEEFVLCGHSMGGMITQMYALNFPHRKLKGIVLCSTAPSIHGPPTLPPELGQDVGAIVQALTSGEVSEEMERAFARMAFAPEFADGHPELVDEAFSEGQKCPPTVKAALLEALMTKFDVKDRISQIKLPTLILVGTEDLLTSVEQSELINSKIDNSKLVTFPGVGHMISIECPDAVNGAIGQFMERL